MTWPTTAPWAPTSLGLPQAVVPDEAKQDHIFLHSGGARPGRDGCRTPMPWTNQPGVGFSPEGADQPWLPVPANWGSYAVERQQTANRSTLHLYRNALQVRRRHESIGSGKGQVTRCGDLLRVRLTGPSGATADCWANMGSEPAIVPATGSVLLSSGENVRTTEDAIVIPANTAVWAD